MTILLDVAPEVSTAGIAIGVGFFLAFVAVAYIAFRIMRRTMKMALRLAIVGAILLVACIGGISIYWFSSGKPARTPRPPAPTRSR
jgi:hypothetical protein